MKTVAIIAEYNPFHIGHEYHLKNALELSGANYSIALMGGNFLQRGQAAMWDKYTRGSMCVSSGIDLAIELPFPYATGSAMDFSTGAINIIDRLNSVDYLCFGAETSDITLLEQVASIILDEPDLYKNRLTDYISSGISYPSAREKAIYDYTHNSKYSDILSLPNNILAIEYICALKKINSTIKPLLVERKTAGYHEDTLRKGISSATSIRNFLQNCNPEVATNDVLSHISDSVSPHVLDIIMSTYNKTSPVFADALTPFLQSKLLTTRNLSHICDMTPELSNKLLNTDLSATYNEIINSVKTKNITHSRISRCLIHLLLDYTEDDRRCFIQDNYAYYANILCFKKDSSTLIKSIHESSSIPLITKKADFNDVICSFSDINTDNAKRMWQLDTDATKLYNCLIYNSYHTKTPNDYTQKLPIL